MKKKILAIAVLLCFANNLASYPNHSKKEEIQLIKKANYSNSGTNYNVSGLGYGYDLIKSGYNDPSQLKTESDIFQDAFLNDRINNGVLNNAINSSTTQSETSSSYEEMVNKYNINIGKRVSLGLNIELLNIGYTAGFAINNNIDYSNYLTKHYYHTHGSYNRYNFTLKNTADLDLYRNNLKTNYVNKLDDLFSNNMGYDDFVNLFGTHVLTKATYGASLDLYYQLMDKSTILNYNMGANINKSIDVGILGNKDSIGSSDFYAGFGVEYNVDKRWFSENFTCSTTGGEPFAITSLSSYVSGYNSWIKTIDTNPAIINMDRLIPIWDLLPQKYNDIFHKNKLKEFFFNYANSNSDTKRFTYDVKSESISFDYERKDKKIIKDDGYNKNVIDTVVLPSKIKTYVDSGYKYASINLHFTMAEIKEGKQEVYFFKNQNGEDTLLKREDFIYGGKGITTAKETKLYTVSLIPLESLEGFDSIKVKYGAHGDWDDDWYNCNVTLTVAFNLC